MRLTLKSPYRQARIQSIDMKNTVVILGASSPDGIGGALARRFSAEGHHIIVGGRTPSKLEGIVNDLTTRGRTVEAVQVDVTSAREQDALFNSVSAKGPISAVLYNAGNNAIIPFEELTAKQFEQFWRVCCFGGFLTAERAMPILRKQGNGSIFFTGASGSLRGKANFAHFASSKAALRNLSQSLAREYGPHGVHVAHFVIDGIIAGNIAKERFPDYLNGLGEDGGLSPDAIADAYWFVHQQHRTAWTHELDLRPYSENW